VRRGQKAPPIQYAKLLNMPQKELLEPLPIESRFLGGEIMYLCANEDQAKECEIQGKVAYIPEEVQILKTKFKTMSLDEYIQHLRAVHETKKTFPGSRVKG
jgi:hypothetical protein